VHAVADVTLALHVRRRRRSKALQRGHTIRREAGWGFAALTAFFIAGDLDL